MPEAPPTIAPSAPAGAIASAGFLPRCAISAMAFLCAASASHAQSPWRAQAVNLAGADKTLFVVAAGSKPGDKPPELRMWHLAAGKTDADALPQTSRFLEWITGQPHAAAADTDAMKVVYADQTATVWSYYGDRPYRMVGQWSHQSREAPLAWAGDATRPVTYGLARAGSLVPLKTPSTQSTDEDEDERPEVLPPTSSPAFPAGSLVLVRLEAGRWSREPGPAEAALDANYWLAARDGVVYLFWHSADRPVVMSRRTGGTWSPPELVMIEDNLQRGWAGVTEQGPVWIAGVGDSDAALSLHVYTRWDAEWTDQGPAREGREELVVDGARVGVCVSRNRLAVARPGEDGNVQFGWADLSASPPVQFWPLARQSPLSPRRDAGIWESVLLVVALGIFTVALFARREQVNQPAAVPQGFSLAPAWKRLAAAVLDAMPAFIIVGAWMVSRFGEANRPETLEQIRNDPELLSLLSAMNYVMFGLYSLWCTAWELTTRSTPGKRMVGCRVLCADGHAPDRRPLLIRNGIRLMTVLLGAAGLLVSFLMLSLLTRNRQALHDVLAGTIVVSWDGIREARRYDEEQP